MLSRILSSLYVVAFVSLFWFGLVAGLAFINGSDVSYSAVACFAASIGFSVSRPTSWSAKLLWLIYDGLTLFFMALAFRHISPMLGILQASLMRAFGYLTMHRWTLLQMLVHATTAAFLFLVFHFTGEVYIMILLWFGIIFGANINIEHHIEKE